MEEKAPTEEFVAAAAAALDVLLLCRDEGDTDNLAGALGRFAAAIGGTLVGVVVIAYLSLQVYLPESLKTNLEPKMTVAFGTLTIVGVGWLVTKFGKR